MRTVIVNGDGLTVQDVIDVARGDARAELGPGVPARMESSRQVVANAIAGDDPVYGVNTGFGALADTRVGEQDLRTLQGAIVMSHAAGTGEPLDDATVRAVLLLRARTLAAGYSGVRADLPRRLSTTGAPAGAAAAAGDVSYYAPWGNLALFHRPFGFAAGLVKLGALDAGVETLRRPGPLTMKIELIER